MMMSGDVTGTVVVVADGGVVGGLGGSCCGDTNPSCSPCPLPPPRPGRPRPGAVVPGITEPGVYPTILRRHSSPGRYKRAGGRAGSGGAGQSRGGSLAR